MNRWLRIAGASAHDTSDRPELWLPGSLAWVVTVGWLPLIVAVARPPSVSDLTFVGARIVTSGAWPWNAVLLGAGLLAVLTLAFTAAAAANASLSALVRRRPFVAGDAVRLLRVSVLSALPAGIAVASLLLAAAVVAPAEFNNPDPQGGPLMGTLLRLAPYIGLAGLTVVAGVGISTIAGRLAIDRRAGTIDAMRTAGRLVTRPASVIHLLVSVLLAIGLVIVASLLLGVLWAPIRVDLAAIGWFDLGTGLLLVGFVAVWLCIVLGGGALHAWSFATWSRLVATDAAERT